MSLPVEFVLGRALIDHRLVVSVEAKRQGGTFRIGVDAEKLKAVLKAMNDSEEGKTILRSIRVQSFVDLDKERLAKAEALFLGK